MGQPGTGLAMLVRELTPRERAVVLFVGRLGQAGTGQIRALFFDTVSRVSMDRTLRRLVASKHLVMLGRRASGPKGGTGSGVYALGSKGWWYCGKGEYPGRVALDDHTLCIADIFTALLLMDRDGTIQLLPDTEVEKTVGHQRADIYVDAAIPMLSKRRRRYVEVQLSARPHVIRKKIKGYWDTYNGSSQASWPKVVFVVYDPWHAHKISRLIPQHMNDLFSVQMAGEFLEGLVKP